MPRRTWSEADELALVELYGTCTLPQLAEYVGKPVSATNQKLSALAKKGLLKRVKRDLTPWHVKAGRLVAKTCPTCGLLREARYFPVAGRGHLVTCSVCVQRRGGKKGLSELHQAMTLVQASKRGEPYTEADMRVLQDVSKSNLQVALELGRTLYAVAVQRSELGVNPLKTPRRAVSHWVIDFPNAQRVLAEHFASLGRAAPESEWEW